jgi:CHASE2 domain-containing sensor protein
MPLWKQLLRRAVAIAFCIALMLLFGRLSLVHKLEPVISDAVMRITPAPDASPVAVVTITEGDYGEMFGHTSPLNPAELSKLIGLIAKGQPAVIGVDIDTSAPQFKRFQLDPAARKTPIVWEREVREIPEHIDDTPEPLDILGGMPGLDPSRTFTGIALLLDEEGVTRQYRQLIKTTAGELPSFPWQIAAVFRKREGGGSESERTIQFWRDTSHRVRLSASKVAELATGWPQSSPVRGKVVLLGGSYLDQDRHETPIGRINGVDVMANVLETELVKGGGDEVPGKASLLLLDVFESFALITLFHVLSMRMALLWSILFIPVVAVLCSFAGYHNAGQWWRFVPILLGLVLFEVYEHYRRHAVPGLFAGLSPKLERILKERTACR